MSSSSQSLVQRLGAWIDRELCGARGEIGANTHLTQETEGDACTEELAKMLMGEVAKCLDDMFLNVRGIVGIVIEEIVGEIGIVDGVVDGDGDLVVLVVVDDGARDTCPHRLLDYGRC